MKTLNLRKTFALALGIMVAVTIVITTNVFDMMF
jgi:hypothetical protein